MLVGKHDARSRHTQHFDARTHETAAKAIRSKPLTVVSANSIKVANSTSSWSVPWSLSSSVPNNPYSFSSKPMLRRPVESAKGGAISAGVHS